MQEGSRRRHELERGGEDVGLQAYVFGKCFDEGGLCCAHCGH